MRLHSVSVVCDVCRQQLKLSLKLEADDSKSGLVESMAVDLLVAGKLNQPSAIDKDLDAMTLDAVHKVGRSA